MESFTIYPAIDLRGGMVVRLRQGKRDEQTNYSEAPAEAAKEWTKQGARWIHVVNLDGAFGEPSRKNQATIQSILEETGSDVKIQLGGGFRTIEQITAALNMGVARIVLGTAVIENPAFGEVVLDRFGGEKIAFGFDAHGQNLMSRGWLSDPGVEMLPLAGKLADAGAQTLIYTNIQKDGMQTGVDWENAINLSDQTGLDVIASGGTSSLADIKAVRLAGLSGVIIGRALYEGNFTLKEAFNVR
ncbi:MAG: 1-(5-phosphoribosyl)-5-[(5-phosphoribosylamino)methylideneamino]imidazole-4-carboxamide isomerase [Anaerolineales bacterium]|nr:1-(5-phosphoribosyl)-5-[(5-phosphoribosylamino)methylideneamino]imidazole-4-carboxamide isomerase [Anaerolineales bacterium]